MVPVVSGLSCWLKVIDIEILVELDSHKPLSLEMNNRFDIGQLLATSLMSSPSVVRICVTMALRCALGSRPLVNGALIIAMMNSNCKSISSRRRNVRIRSSRQDLMMARLNVLLWFCLPILIALSVCLLRCV